MPGDTPQRADLGLFVYLYSFRTCKAWLEGDSSNTSGSEEDGIQSHSNYLRRPRWHLDCPPSFTASNFWGFG